MFGVSSAHAFFDGNVGIGTNNPVAKLHVAGNVNFTGLRTETTLTAHNVIGGNSANTVTAGVVGATIACGGGGAGGAHVGPNRVSDDFGTVGGGQNNTAGEDGTAFGAHATASGGFGNNARGRYSTVPGGLFNTAQGNYSLAAGQRAQTLHQGSFVWSDSTTIDPSFFSSTADNQFLINATSGVGIGTNAPSARLHVRGTSNAVDVPVAIVESTGPQVPLSFRRSAIEVARIRSDENGNLVFATLNGLTKNIYFRAGDELGTDMFIQSSSGNIGIGTTEPTALLHVAGSVKIALPSAGTGAALCRNADTSLVVDCSGSSARYKQNIFGLRPGLDVVRRLRPVSFTWKQDGQRDIGLVAEEVNRVEPLLTTRNDKGEVEGVRYDRLGVVLLNAVREQQQQLQAQQLTVKQHKGQIVAQQQQLQQKHLQIEKLERRLALLEAAIKKLGPHFDETLDHRTEVGIRSRAQRSRTTRR